MDGIYSGKILTSFIATCIIDTKVQCSLLEMARSLLGILKQLQLVLRALRPGIATTRHDLQDLQVYQGLFDEAVESSHCWQIRQYTFYPWSYN